jgi:signal transduction histidine kinase
MDPRSLTFRLVAWYCGLLLVVGGVFGVYTYEGFTSHLRAVMRDTLSARAQDAADLARPLLHDSVALAIEIDARFEPEAHDRYMSISIDDKVLYVSGPPAAHLFDPGRLTTMRHTDSALRSLGNLWLYTRVEHLPGPHLLIVETGQLDALPNAAQRGLIATLLSALPVLLAIAAYGGYRLVRRALAPVAGMINAAEALTFNTPSKRLPAAGTGDVIDELSRTLNRMLERLDSAYQHANKFSADAAHELRTPLAIMHGQLEFVASRQDLPDEVASATEDALNENIRLGQIVENLIAMTLIDGVGGKRTHLPVELAALAVETIEQMRLLAEEKRITLSCQEGERVVTLADRSRLKQVVVNLVDNAIKYTPHDGSVTVVVKSDSESALLEVTDSGIGIAPEHHQSVFERFFRVSPDRGASGAGLGLAISKSICVAHGGSVEVISSLGRGSIFRVRLPLAPARSMLLPTVPAT